jgi:DNA polymerase-3 subunit delta
MACYEDEAATTMNIIRQKFKENNITAESGVAQWIVNKLGKNRLIILNELEKLMIYCGQKNITLEDAQLSIADIAEISATELINNFAELDAKKANYFLEKLYDEKVNAIALIRMISGYFLKLQIVKNNVESGANIETEIRNQRLYFKQEPIFKKHLQRWPKSAMDNILLKIQELEVDCKSSNSNPELLLASFINLTCVKYGAKKTS